MTRKKWNRLRRQYPDLFKFKASWDSPDMHQRDVIRKMSKREVIAAFTAEKLLRP